RRTARRQKRGECMRAIRFACCAPCVTIGSGAAYQQQQASMSKIQRIIVPDIRPPVSHYCHVTRAGPHVWVAGVVGQAPDGTIPPDVGAQFDQAIAVMDKCLRAAGAGPQHVVKVQVFMTDITERPKINPRRIAYFGDNLPASTLVEVKALVDPRMKVEIE